MDRKELIQRYKDTPIPIGVYRVCNKIKVKSLVGSSTNLRGILNRHRFQLENGSHPDKELQQDWKEFGDDAFIFEILDQLESSDDAGGDPTADIHVLLTMWIEKLKESGESLYEESIKLYERQKKSSR